MFHMIPKNTKIKTTIIGPYSVKDMFIALIFIVLILILFSSEIPGKWIFIILFSIIFIVCMLPTQDGLVYETGIVFIRYLLKPKVLSSSKTAKKKEQLNTVVKIKNIMPDGLIEYADGRVGRVMEVNQKPFGLEDEGEQDLDISRLAMAFIGLQTGLTLDLVKVDRPVTLDFFGSQLVERVKEIKESDLPEEEKTLKTNILTSRLSVIDTYNNTDKIYLPAFYFIIYGKTKNEVDDFALSFSEQLLSVGLGNEFPDQREVAVFLRYNFTIDFDERDVDKINERDLVSWCTPKNIETYSNKLIIDGKEECSSFVLTGYPTSVGDGWAANLFKMPASRVVMHLTPVEREKAVHRIDKAIGELNSRVDEMKASEAEANALHLDSMNELMYELQASGEVLFDVSFVVNAYNFYKIKDYKKSVKRIITANRCKSTAAWCEQTMAWSSFVFGDYEKTMIKYERGIPSSSVAAAFPFVSPIVMDPEGINLGYNRSSTAGYPFFFDMWKRDDEYQNSNMWICGKSGSGKSFFLKSLVANEWSDNTKIMILDPEAEYLALARALGGVIIDPGNSVQGRINPFHIYNVLTEEGEESNSSVAFNAHLKTLESFFRIVLDGVSQDILELINSYVVEAYARRGITEETNILELEPEDFPLFDDLMDVVQLHKGDMDLDDYSRRDIRTAEIYLKKFVTGRYADIWNHPSTLSFDGNIVVFNFQSLFSNKNNIVANAQMLLIFRSMEQEIINIRERNRTAKLPQRVIILADEAHLFIDEKAPISLDFFYQMCKRIRKYNGAFIAATQNVSDWNASPELCSKTTAIIKNSQYQFIFHLASSDMDDLNDLFSSSSGFNETEKAKIVNATRGQAFFIGSNYFRTCVMIDTPEYITELFDDTYYQMRQQEEVPA